jgi:hypothetical protein
MIYVRVGNQDMLNGGRRNGRFLPVQQTESFHPLEHSAIDQEPQSSGVHEVLRAGDGAGRA